METILFLFPNPNYEQQKKNYTLIIITGDAANPKKSKQEKV